MVDASETRLRVILQEIARNHGYLNEEVNVKPIWSGGANYTSKLFTATVSSPGKQDLRLFSKVASLAERMRNMMTLSLVEIETRFYTKILPRFRELEERYKIPVEERLISAEYFGSSMEGSEEVLVLEDLSVKGFQTMHRSECFDWEYASRSVSALARFHALSVAFEKLDPVGYSSLVDGLKFNYPADQNYLIKGVITAVEATDEEYRDRVEKFLRDDLEKQTFMKFYEPASRQPVLCHGDFRASNILYKPDKDGNLTIAKVDYQVIRRGNPVADLMFFLICGSDEQFRAAHLDQFFDHYYEEFSRALRRLSIDPHEVYTEKEYRDDVKQMLPSGLTCGVYFLPFLTVEDEDAPKPEDCVEVQNLELKLGDRFRDRFNGLVRTYIQLGFI